MCVGQWCNDDDGGKVSSVRSRQIMYCTVLYSTVLYSAVILVRFSLNLNYLDRFSKNAQISNLIKIRLVGAEFLREDRQMDRQTDRRTDIYNEAKSGLSQFCERA
jgi:hypothetical protein